MTDKMLKFVKIGQQTPPKRETDVRKKDFNEIYDEFINEKAKDQSSRCSQCGVPFCQVHCPLSNNIPDWLKLTAEGRLKEAYELSQSTNNMPEVCGRICPQDRLCEGNCVIEQSGHGTVTIGSIEKYITDNAWEQGWVKPINISNEKNESIGIIGAGPAGLAAAEELRKSGYKITVYDRYDRAGGLLIYGIPNFKLEKEVVERRTKLLKDGGIEFIQNFEVGKDASLEQLRKKHDAILIATGVYKAREIELPGNDLNNIFPAMDFLTASNKKGLGDKVELFDKGILNAEGKDIVVIGGGDTAMDCVRTSIRQKAKSVKCLYRRDKENMPGSAREVANAEEEGVEFVWLSSPKEFKGTNKVEKLIKFLVENKVNPIGLGARDTLRLEAGLCLYGHDLNEKTNPIEANLKWAIAKRRREEGGFNGWEKIKELMVNGSNKKRVGILPEGRIIARENTKVFSDHGEEIGLITSGTFGPSVNASVAMGYINSEFSDIGTKIKLEVRGKKHGGKVSELPFFKKSYVK